MPNGVGGTVDNVCDPTGGFRFTQNTIDNFGKINILRGRRIVEFALKYYSLEPSPDCPGACTGRASNTASPRFFCPIGPAHSGPRRAAASYNRKSSP